VGFNLNWLLTFLLASYWCDVTWLLTFSSLHIGMPSGGGPPPPPPTPHPLLQALITNSGKYAHYAPGLINRDVRFSTMAGCVAAARSGKAPSTPSWLAHSSFSTWAGGCPSPSSRQSSLATWAGQQQPLLLVSAAHLIALEVWLEDHAQLGTQHTCTRWGLPASISC
jgi:hypothetical protein